MSAADSSEVGFLKDQLASFSSPATITTQNVKVPESGCAIYALVQMPQRYDDRLGEIAYATAICKGRQNQGFIKMQSMEVHRTQNNFSRCLFAQIGFA